MVIPEAIEGIMRRNAFALFSTIAILLSLTFPVKAHHPISLQLHHFGKSDLL
jgi:hypothetical protein